MWWKGGGGMGAQYCTEDKTSTSMEPLFFLYFWYFSVEGQIYLWRCHKSRETSIQLESRGELNQTSPSNQIHRTGVVDTAVQKYSNKCTITHKRVRLKSFRMYQPPTPLPTDDVANELPPQTSTYSIIFDAKGWIYRRGRGQNENAVTHGNIISRENRSVHIFLLYYKKINQDTTQAHPCFGAAFCAPNHWWSLSACCPGERSLSTPGSFSRSTSVSSASMSVKLSSPKLALYVVTPQY